MDKSNRQETHQQTNKQPEKNANAQNALSPFLVWMAAIRWSPQTRTKEKGQRRAGEKQRGMVTAQLHLEPLGLAPARLVLCLGLAYRHHLLPFLRRRR